jgi:CarD family transcriptional regulator
MPESLHLSVGDRVVYPNQGLCTVTEIKAEQIAGQTLVFVSLVFLETGARVKVPQDKLEKNGVRRVATSVDVSAVFEFLRADSVLASLDWKKRAFDNTKLLATGGLLGLATVVKTLAGLTDLRPLPPKERDLYNDARHLLIHELAAALNGTEADAEDSIDIVLFPVGKERAKRAAEDFKVIGLVDDELGLSDDLLGLDVEGSEGSLEESPEAAAADGGDAEGAQADEVDEKPVAAETKKKRGRPPKAKVAGPAMAPRVVAVPDAVVTQPEAAMPADAQGPKKRGRSPKPKVPALVEAGAETASPPKRARAPKAKK